MAHFAQINDDGIVINVVFIQNDEIVDSDGVESELIGVELCSRLYGGVWVETSYNANIRGNYAGIGYKYDKDLDLFIPPCIYESWTFNATAAKWEPPINYPDPDNSDYGYYWDELTGGWLERTPPKDTE